MCGMLEARGEPDLLAEAVGRDGVGQLGREDLEHHLAVERDFGREEDARHAAAAELALESVGVAHYGLELRAQIHFRASRL